MGVWFRVFKCRLKLVLFDDFAHEHDGAGVPVPIVVLGRILVDIRLVAFEKDTLLVKFFVQDGDFDGVHRVGIGNMPQAEHGQAVVGAVAVKPL